MHGRSRDAQRHRGPYRLRPTFERVEGRQLPSAIIAVLASQRPSFHAVRPAAAGTVHSDAGGQGGGGGSGSATGGGGTMMLNNEFLNPTGTPTPHEVRRQTFRAVFVGPFLQGPGRFDNVASTLYIKGAGSSTYFNHGDAQLGAFIPKDRSVPATGQLTSFDRNINANSAFSFDLVGDPQAVDRFGRPTRFTATVDVTTSSGIFVEAQGQGTVTIRYFPSGTHRPGVISEGKAIIVIKGQFYTLGTANILSVLGTHNSPGSSMYKL